MCWGCSKSWVNKKRQKNQVANANSFSFCPLRSVLGVSWMLAFPAKERARMWAPVCFNYMALLPQEHVHTPVSEILSLMLASLCSVPQGRVSHTDLPFFITVNLLWLPRGFSIYPLLFASHPVIGVPPTWLHPISVRSVASWTFSSIFNFNWNTGTRKQKTMSILLIDMNPQSTDT